MTFDPTSTVGTPILDVDTPAPLLDLDVFEDNARRISGFLAENGLEWRPHSKAHKSPRLAAIQIGLGANGVTCAKLGEAEVMVEGGVHSVLVANHLGTPAKWRRAAALQQRAEVIVCVDDPEHVRMAGEAGREAGVEIPVLIEVDIGMHRVGTRSESQSASLADLIAATDGIRLAGIMGYEGHLLTVWPEEEKQARCTESLTLLVAHAEAVRSAGHEVPIVSSGGSGSFRNTAHVDGLTESQAGGGCLMCRFYAEECHVDLGHALSLTTTVVSVRPPEHAVVDAGFKTFGNLPGMGLPLIIGREGVAFRSLSAEHGQLTVEAGAEPLRIGDRIHAIPAYSDSMLVNHDWILGHRGGVVTEVIPMPGRGRLV
jgi:D-serine deaminase-like pyridoxal phosphate-dependent protein